MKKIPKNKKIQTVILGGREITYECTRKKVKNINLRVHSDGKLFVSAPFFVSDQQIDAVLTEKKDFILRALARFAEAEKNKPMPFSFADGEKISLFGKEYRLYFTEEKCRSFAENDTLILFVRDKKDTEMKRKALKTYAENELRLLLDSLCADIYPLFEKATPMPEIKLRLMRARWGSCAPKKAVLTFNTNLAFYPISCIEYVVMHEFTHFLHANHSKAFYNALAEKMPDWKERKTGLNAVPMVDILSKDTKGDAF
ncbi:MAG: M48 family metallopeptidase [Clostridia bacterium]|nr:M48 family metallopeptidase [Clostridia bacterium]